MSKGLDVASRSSFGRSASGAAILLTTWAYGADQPADSFSLPNTPALPLMSVVPKAHLDFRVLPNQLVAIEATPPIAEPARAKKADT